MWDEAKCGFDVYADKDGVHVGDYYSGANGTQVGSLYVNRDSLPTILQVLAKMCVPNDQLEDLYNATRSPEQKGLCENENSTTDSTLDTLVADLGNITALLHPEDPVRYFDFSSAGRRIVQSNGKCAAAKKLCVICDFLAGRIGQCPVVPDDKKEVWERFDSTQYCDYVVTSDSRHDSALGRIGRTNREELWSAAEEAKCGQGNERLDNNRPEEMRMEFPGGECSWEFLLFKSRSRYRYWILLVFTILFSWCCSWCCWWYCWIEGCCDNKVHPDPRW